MGGLIYEIKDFYPSQRTATYVVAANNFNPFLTFNIKNYRRSYLVISFLAAVLYRIVFNKPWVVYPARFQTSQILRPSTQKC